MVTGADGQTILEVSFQDGDSTDPLNLWPREPDGQGPSLVPSGAGTDPNDPTWWKVSSKIGGSPGGPDTVVVDPFENWKSNHFNAEQLADSSISDFIYAPSECDTSKEGNVKLELRPLADLVNQGVPPIPGEEA